MATLTAYGRKLLSEEVPPVPHPLGGATAHMHECAYDTGLVILLIGQDAEKRHFTRVTRSVHGALASADALWAVRNAWHVLPDGSRRLVFRR